MGGRDRMTDEVKKQKKGKKTKYKNGNGREIIRMDKILKWKKASIGKNKREGNMWKMDNKKEWKKVKPY